MLHISTNGVFTVIESNYEKGGHDGHHVEKMRLLRDHGSASRKFFVQKFIQGAMLSGPTTKNSESMLDSRLEIRGCLLHALELCILRDGCVDVFASTRPDFICGDFRTTVIYGKGSLGII